MINKRTTITALLLGSMVSAVSSPAPADIVEYVDKEVWEAGVEQVTTIGFSDLPDGTWVTEQYAGLGVHFVDGWDQVIYGESFLEDGAGIAGGEYVELVFDQSMYWIAADFPGNLGFDLYFEGEFLYRSTEFGTGGYGNFGGLVSTEPFDRAVLWEYGTHPNVFIDDLHFGPPIPAPTALSMFTAALLAGRRRRRR
jgi:hypothetical protein